MIADDQTRAKINRMLSLKSPISERVDFVSNILVDFEPIERFENRRDMMMKPWYFHGGIARAAEFNNS